MNRQKPPLTRPGDSAKGQHQAVWQMLLLALFFITGAAGLVYEVAWTRLLTSLFGASSPAISTVLTAYMLGLALGGIFLGRLADRSGYTLLLYAAVEGGAALCALVLPWAISTSTGMYVLFYGRLQDQAILLNLLRFAHALVLLLVPTFLMGGTLPLLTSFLLRSGRAAGRQVALLYGVNTLGAALGCVVAGFLLIEWLGVTGATRSAAIAQLLVALVVLALRGKFYAANTATPASPGSSDAGIEAARNPGRVAGSHGTRRSARSIRTQGASPQKAGAHRLPSAALWALIAIGYSGFAALSLENLWTRLLTFFLGNTVYAFTSVIATVLVGIALGSFLARRALARMGDSLRLLGVLQLGIGLCTLLLLPVQWRLNAVRSTVFSLAGGLGWWQLTLAKFAVSAVAFLVPTLGMGASFPCAIAVGTDDRKQHGQFVGTVYGVNAFCGAVGSLVTGFGLIPIIGVQRSIALFAALSMGIGAVLLALRASSTRRRVLEIGGIATAAVVLLALIRTDRPLITIAGVAQGSAPPYRLVDYREGVDATVAVLEDAVGIRELSINGVSTAFTSNWDLRIHKLLAYLPLALHPSPERALIVGYGMGVTVRSVLHYPTIRQVDVVEISPEVMRVSSRFSRVNEGGLDDPRLRVIVNDGKNHLLATDQRYDMISANAIHPGVAAGNGALYTVDFYKAARDHLTPNGVVCQWLPIHQLSTDDLRTLIRSFQVVFPQTSIWFASDFALLIGTANPLRLDLDQIEARLQAPEVKRDLAELGDLAIGDVTDLVGYFLMDARATAACVGDAPLNTDDHPIIEFTSPRSSFLSEETNLANLKLLYQCSQIGAAPIVAGDATWLTALERRNKANIEVLLGQMEAYGGHSDQASQHYLQALALDATDRDARYLARKLIMNEGISAFQQNNVAAAARAFDRALQLTPDYAEGWYRLAVATDKLGSLEQATSDLERAVALNPTNARWRVDLAGYYVQRDRVEDAVSQLQMAVATDPEYGEAHVFLAAAYRRLGRTADAEAELAEALRLERQSRVGW